MSTVAATLTTSGTHVRRDAIRTLGGVEARRALRGPTFWIGLAVTAWFGSESGDLGWQGGAYSAFMLAFGPLAAAIFVCGVLAGGRDRGRDEGGVLAEEAALDATDRSIARLLGLVPLVLIGSVLVVATAIAIRIEGGLWIGNRPGRTDTAVHGLTDVLLPILLLVLGACTGLAAGRTFRRRVPVIVVGIGFWFLCFGAYWALQWAPATYVVPTQVQPIQIAIQGDATDTSAFPADWLLVRPDQRGDDWARVVVHAPLTAWHDVYLVGLATLAAGVAVRSRVGRRLVLIGVVVAGAGIVGQALVWPEGASSVEVPQ